MTTIKNRQFSIITAEQRSPEWFEARLGRVTGSKASAVWERTKKGEPTADWRKYQDQLVAELLTGISSDDVFVSYDMQRGVELEPIARRAAGRQLGVAIRETGFLRHDKLRAGSSLDGDVDDFQAVVEIKCPRTTTHLSYIEAAGLPDAYMGQCMHNLYVSGAQRLIFVSFDDRLPPHLQLFIHQVERSALPMDEYETRLMQFLGELEQRLFSLAKPG